MSRKPTLIFVPGSWHTPSVYDKVITLVEREQYKCIGITLPTATAESHKTFGDDVEAARNAILAETTKGHDVSPDSDHTGHVIGITMIASGFTIAGIAFLDGMGGRPPPSWKLDHDSGLAVLVADPRQFFYHDLPVEEGKYRVSQLTKQSLKALTEGSEHTHAGWKDVPVWYLATTDDQALPIEAQRMFVQMAKDAGGDVTLREIESSHSPMLSKPEETAKFILDAVAAFVGKRE